MRKFFTLLTVAAVMFSTALSYAADKKADKPKPDPEAAFKKIDKDGDGSISEAEMVGKKEGDKATKAKAAFAAKDKDKDGKLSLEEFKAPAAKKPKK